MTGGFQTSMTYDWWLSNIQGVSKHIFDLERGGGGPNLAKSMSLDPYIYAGYALFRGVYGKEITAWHGTSLYSADS